MASISLPKGASFSGNVAAEWAVFKQKLEIFMLASGNQDAPESKKVSLLLTCLGDKGLDIYNSFNLGADEAFKWDTVMNRFETYCNPRKNVSFERHKFFAIVQESGETFDGFLTRIKLQAQRCEFGSLKDSLLRDRLIAGIVNDDVRGKLLQLPDPSLETCIESCQMQELATHQGAQIQATSLHSTAPIPVAAAYNRKGTSIKSKHHKQQTFSEQKIKTCTRCGNEHSSSGICPAKGKICNKCRKPNHFAVVCRSKGTQIGNPKQRYKSVRCVQDSFDSREMDRDFVGTISSKLVGNKDLKPGRSYEVIAHTKPGDAPLLTKQSTVTAGAHGALANQNSESGSHEVAYSLNANRTFWYADLYLNGKDVATRFQIDTGADITCLTKSAAEICSIEIKPSKRQLVGPGKSRIEVLGEAEVLIESEKRSTTCTVVVVKT